MNENSQVVRFDRAFPCRSLNPQSAAHPPCLRGKSLLVLPRADMLDHRVGKYDVILTVWKLQSPGIAGDRPDFGCSRRRVLDQRQEFEIQDIHMAYDFPSFEPVEGIASDIEQDISRCRIQSVHKTLEAPLSPETPNPSVKPDQTGWG